jgi:hypothetical protein
MLPIIHLFIYYFVVVVNLSTPYSVAGVADRKIHYAHKYHGINFSTMDGLGNNWFERGGRKCKLFTEAFEVWYEEVKEGER